MKVFSSIIFALMAVVLPMAGSAHYGCVKDMDCLAGAMKCLSGDADCCGDKDEAPDCLIAKHLLPDAEFSKSLSVSQPSPGVFEWVRVASEERWLSISRSVFLETHREPPDLRRLYVKQQRLLI